ncbi:MAG: 50S ribosomal protein L17 [Patescibacteria group bacterium]
MRRGNKRKFGRVRKQRQALEKGLMTALVTHGRITTTETKAKNLRIVADRLVTTAKKNTLASRRQLHQTLGERAVKKLIGEIAPTFASRSGGYTRLTRLGRRDSDGAPMILVELTS